MDAVQLDFFIVAFRSAKGKGSKDGASASGIAGNFRGAKVDNVAFHSEKGKSSKEGASAVGIAAAAFKVAPSAPLAKRIPQ